MDGQKHKGLVLVTPRIDAYSETFIRAQIDALQPELVLHGGFLPHLCRPWPFSGSTDRTITLGSNDHPTEIPRQHLQQEIVSLLRQHGVHHILAQYGPTGAEILAACRQADASLVVHFHGYDASHRPALEKYADQYREMFAYATRIIAVSRAMVTQLENLGCPTYKILYNPYGVRQEFFQVHPARDASAFVSVGRFVEKKGPAYTIRAFKIVSEQYPNARLFMAGEGPLLDVCRGLVASLGLEGRVFFPGIIRHDMMPLFMQKALAYVQHSLVAGEGDSEGTPVSILEASAASLPVVSTRHAGISDVVQEGENGLLVAEQDVEAMARAMIQVWEDRVMAARMGLAGREIVRSRFSMDGYIKGLLDVLNG
jgi:colanic acid/amylovoran biosynthesis glycosyltransferase